MRFFDREKEIEVLLRSWSLSKSGAMNFVVIYGGRGVGKTRLIHEVFIDEKNFLYLFVENFW